MTTATKIIERVALESQQYHEPLKRLAREVGRLRAELRRVLPDPDPKLSQPGSFFCEATIDGLGDCVVFYDYSAGRPGVHTLRNGDPGYPDDPAELYVTVVQIGGGEFDAEVFAQDVQDKLEAAAQADVERRYEAAQAEQYEGMEYA